MFVRLWVLFVLVPCLELALLIVAGKHIGIPQTVGIILLTATVGAWLARREGAAAIRRIGNALREGRMPTREIADGALIFAAGLLLLTPGFLTDVAGLLLLIPPSRTAIRGVLLAYLKRRVHIQTTISPPPANDPRGGSVIDSTDHTVR